jgi:hypothetical protein
MTLTAHVAYMGEKCMQSCDRKAELEDNIKMDLKYDWKVWT